MTVAYKDRRYIGKLDMNDVADRLEIKTAMEAAYQAANEVTDFRGVGGCGRVYVELGKIRKNSKVAKELAKYCHMTERPFGTGLRIYVGYDNATGREWYQGKAMAETLNEYGFHAYVDGDGD